MNKKLAIAALSCALAIGAVAAPRAEIIEQILVKVNGEIFTKSDLEQRQVASLRAKGQQIDMKAEIGNPQLKQMLDEVTPQILVDAVDEMIVVQRGKELGYKLADDQFKSVVDNIRKENKLEDDAAWEGALKQENMTLPELRRNLEKQMIVSRVQQNEVFGKIGVSDEDARKYYDAHLSEFTTLPSITLREILVNTPGDGQTINVGQDDEAKAKADKIRTRLIQGESFEKVAAAESDSPSKANAGLIGPLSLSDLSPDMRKIIEPMKTGQITAPLRTPRGYQLLKLEAKTDAQTLAFEQARDQISDKVFTDKRKDEFAKYIEKLRAQAIIEWKNADVKKAYDERVGKKS